MDKSDDLEDLTPEERLQAENDLLKIKLEMEFGMKDMGVSPDMGEGMQNDFLNYIYNWEKQFAERKTIKVFDRIGQPNFKKITALSQNEIASELDRLLKNLVDNGISFNAICEYDDDIIYKFITEELFEQEMDDIRIDGMMTNFIFEEFHPNHDYDIRKQADDFIENLIIHKWNDFLNSTLLADKVIFNNKSFEKDLFIPIIKTFQEHNQKIELLEWTIENVAFDLYSEKASLKGKINYKSIDSGELFEGLVNFEFILDYNFWSISKIVFPGFSQSF